MGKIHKNVLVVGLRGPAGVGKSHLAEGVLCTMDRGFTLMLRSFAGPIKSGLAAMGICKKTTPEAYRKYAQIIGAGMRASDPDHWVDLFRKEVTLLGDREVAQVVVADDLRYPNEAAVCDLIFRVEPIGFKATDLGELADHESETWNRIDQTTGQLIGNEWGHGDRTAAAIVRTINRALKEPTNA